MNKPKPIYGWTWAIQSHDGARWELCWWCRPTRADLLGEERPSPEAKPVRVLMSPVIKARY